MNLVKWTALTISPLGLALAIAGCGNPTTTTTTPADMAIAYSPVDYGPETPTDASIATATEAVVLTGAFPSPSGGLNTIKLAGDVPTKGIDNTLDADSVVHTGQGKVYVLMRTHGVLRIYDPAANFANPTEIVTGDVTAASDGGAGIAHDQTDPTDALPIPSTSKIYVAAYANDAAHSIGVIDSTKPEQGVQKWIAVPASAKSPLARPTELWFCGPLVYVLLEDLDDTFSLTGPGRIAVIDPATDALVADGNPSVIQLMGTNPGGGFPYGMARFSAGYDDVLVSDAGDLSGKTMDLGGIERVDLTLRTSSGMILSGATDLKGNLGPIGSASPTLMFAVVGALSNKVVAIDPTNKKVLGDVTGTASYIPFVQVSPDNQLFVGVNATAGGGQIATGLYVGPADGTMLTAAPIMLDQPPYGLAFF